MGFKENISFSTSFFLIICLSFSLWSCFPEEPPVPKRLEFRFSADNISSEIIAGNDTLQITQVKFLIEKFNLLTPGDDTLQTQRGVLPVTYDRASAGTSALIVAGNIGFDGFDTFNKFELFVRPLSLDDGIIDNTLLENGEGYSISFRGIYNGETFLHRSKVDFEKNYEFSNVQITSQEETLLIILNTDVRNIFINGSTLIDPTDSSNSELINNRFQEFLLLEISSEQSLPFN